VFPVTWIIWEVAPTVTLPKATAGGFTIKFALAALLKKKDAIIGTIKRAANDRAKVNIMFLSCIWSASRRPTNKNPGAKIRLPLQPSCRFSLAGQRQHRRELCAEQRQKREWDCQPEQQEEKHSRAVKLGVRRRLHADGLDRHSYLLLPPTLPTFFDITGTPQRLWDPSQTKEALKTCTLTAA
jgi:hypothetical protein